MANPFVNMVSNIFKVPTVPTPTMSVLPTPSIIEREHSALTISWDAIEDSDCYELAISEDSGLNWRVLSDSLTIRTIRKKNLVEDVDYIFRIRYRQKATGEWSTHSEPSESVRVIASTILVMDAPTIITRDSSSVTLQWPEVSDCSGYRLRFRTESSTWQEVASVIRGTTVKKKGLLPGEKYFFSVIPADTPDYEYSPSSVPVSISLSSFMVTLLPSTLLTRNPSAPTVKSDVLAGKVVGVYFSAHWCGPCRNFTPSLASVYQQAKAAVKDFEIIFCSCDHSESEFSSYYTTSMPWLAVPYGDDKREELAGKFRVSGIPRLAILAPSGRILVDNAAGQSLSLATVDSWIELGKTA